MNRTTWNLAWAVMVAGVLLIAPLAVAQAADDAAVQSEDTADENATGEDADAEGAGAEGTSDSEGGASTDYEEEIVVIGTRRAEARSVTDSPVPIDVISSEDFNTIAGSADLTDNLKTLVPSYTATPATGDGSAFVRPTSLRGTAPDQTLIMVNGKRRHRSALVQFFAPAAGNGAHGVDVGMIPGIAIKQVEVLRDGAAAQYGSDAIAGVINFEMKDSTDIREVQLQYGQHYESETSLKGAFNGGFNLPKNGFLNLSLEYLDNDALSRGIQRPDAQALIDAGVQGVGADTPFGDQPLTQTWGRPETKGTRFFLNSGMLLNDSTRLYFQSNYADTDGRYRFFYRDPLHPSLVPLREQGFTGLQGGYTPFLDGAQKDLSLVGGVGGLFGADFTYDFSLAFGKNELDYFLNNTINQDLGLVNGQPAQRDFDVGGYEQEEFNVGADFAKLIGMKVNLAFGAEWRQETYTAVQGEPNSFLGAGANGLKGVSDRDAGSFDRNNVAVYVDVEQDVSEAWLMQYALRYEDFSDFGGTLNWKLASRYSVSPKFTLRGAVSTGFHAPTPGQANVRTTITTFDGTTGQQVEEGLVPSTSPLVEAVGGKPLTEETSLNYSFGFSSHLGRRTTLTIDGYVIQVEDRIYRTGDIPVPTLPGGVARSISFYTNALDVDSKGIDLVLSSRFDWATDVTTDVSLAFSYNEVSVEGQSLVNGVAPVNDAIIEDIENNYPNDRFVLNTNTRFAQDWNALVRLNYYGKHFDERGRIGADVDPSVEIGTTVYVDLELGLQVTPAVRVAVGAVNVFDTFINTVGPPNSNRLSVGLQYPRRSAANYEGGSWYLRGRFTF